MKINPSISVIIPVYNSEKTIGYCLDSVFSSDYQDFEVIVINDNCSDNSMEIANKFPCKVVNIEENLGPAAARNRGVDASIGNILFFLDADIIIEKNTLREVEKTFQIKPEIDAFFCSYNKNSFYSDFFSQYKNLLHHFTHQTSNENAATFCGGYGGIKRHVFLSSNGYNEQYRSLEDIEFGYRLHHAGKKIFLNKNIQLTHCKKYTLKSLISSDLLNRAIPWTIIMLQKRIWKNDLNTKTQNIFSVLIAFLILFNLPLLIFFEFSRYSFCVLLIFFLFLNREFFLFLYKEKGPVFTIKSIIMNWFNYLYSGVGLIIGFVGFLKQALNNR
jgi:glycosyltransferase involved in cell wall biosynthesis